MNSEPAKCDWIFLLPGFLHIIMGAQAALRDVDWHGPGPGHGDHCRTPDSDGI